MRNKWQPKILLKFPRLSTSRGALRYIVFAYSPALKTLEIPQTVQMPRITSITCAGDARHLDCAASSSTCSVMCSGFIPQNGASNFSRACSFSTLSCLFAILIAALRSGSISSPKIGSVVDLTQFIRTWRTVRCSSILSPRRSGMYVLDDGDVCGRERRGRKNSVHCDDPDHPAAQTRCNCPGRKMARVLAEKFFPNLDPTTFFKRKFCICDTCHMKKDILS